MSKLRENKRVFLLTSGVVGLVLWPMLCDKVAGQSGRRAPRTLPATTATEPTPLKAETDSAEPEPEKRFYELKYPVQLLIARQLTSKHLASEDIIFNSFIKRLNELKSINGTVIGTLKREQAAKRAQSETDAYVVLVQFEIDNYQGGKIIFNSPDLEVKYFVYPPLSDKPQLKGKVYYQSMGGPQGRRADSPSDPPVRITVEAAGHEAAERLYFWLAEIIGTRNK